MSTTAYQFFLEHAGYSWDPAVETQEVGRDRCARALASAEERGTELGFTCEFSEDGEADRSFMDTPDYSAEDRRCAEFYCAVVRDAAGEVLTSVSGIHEDIRDPQGARDYRRVVRAELFMEGLEFHAIEEAKRAAREVSS